MSRSRLWDCGPAQVVFVAASLVVLIAGCRPGGYSGPVGTVSGTVTLNGTPVPEGCRVTFISQGGFTASGKVGAGGSYRLAVVGEGGAKDQIPVASYKVCVTPPATGGGGETAAEGADYDKLMQQGAAVDAAPSEQPAAAGVIPPKYRSTGTSGLSYEVKEGANTIQIELK